MNYYFTRTIIFAVLVATVSSFTGCGSNKDDAFMRAAMRSRSDSDEEAPPTAPPADAAQASDPANTQNSSANTDINAQTVDSTQSISAAAMPAVPAAQPNTVPGSGVSNAVVSEIKIPPIAERKPTEALDAFARTKRSNENLKLIGKAIRSYIDRTGFLPPHTIKSKSGAGVLSWRVAILPDLGYADLYAAFDLESPWDSDKNSKLLDRIPDCFVSPERFDISTNYLAFVGNDYIFRDLTLDRGSVSDGLENTLAVVEVDDQHAVPWTCPQDYTAPWKNATDGLGKLRADGFLAVWASGSTTRIRADVDPLQLFKALTPDSGDMQLAATIHQPVIPIGTDSSSASAATEESAMLQPAIGASTSRSGTTPTTTNTSAIASLPRMPAPSDALVQAAIERVQSLYSSRFKEARQLSDRTTIASEMLDSAMLMREDPAGAYAMHEAVLSVATAMGDFSLLVKAIDGRVQMFEIDAITENAERLVDFTKSNTGPIAAQIDQTELMRRCVPVIAESIRKDSYDLPIELVRHLITMDRMAKKRGSDLNIAQLRTQLSVAKGYLDQATDAIVTLRSDESDPVSNGAVGRYTAFIKGDWKAGLEMLVRGDNEKLASMAKADLNASSDTQQILTVADAWYDLGQSTSNKVFRGGCYERAAHWYTIAHDALPESLSKVHARTRMAESNAAATGSPLALVQQIAQYIGFDLDQEIAMIKNPAAKALQNNTYED